MDFFSFVLVFFLFELISAYFLHFFAVQYRVAQKVIHYQMIKNRIKSY